MNQEQIIERLRYDSGVVKDFVVKQSGVVKDFVVKQYHRIADFPAEKKIEKPNNGCTVMFGMRCSKYVFILMNIFYLFISLFMIFTGTSSYLALKSFYDLLWFDVQVLCIIWIMSGVVLTFISVFGIIGALKESIAMSNLYGVLLLITFCLQIITSIAAFFLVTTGSSTFHSFNLIDRLMKNYYHDSNSAQKMDYIQSTFQCCGGKSPSEWDTSVTVHQYDLDYEYDTTTDASTTLKIKTPASCCSQDSSYQDNTCDNYYEKGCTMFVTDFISETMLIVASVLLAIGVLQILGMVCSFMLARMFRRAATYRNIEKFSSLYENIFDVPTTVDYRPLNNTSDA